MSEQLWGLFFLDSCNRVAVKEALVDYLDLKKPFPALLAEDLLDRYLSLHRHGQNAYGKDLQSFEIFF